MDWVCKGRSGAKCYLPFTNIGEPRPCHPWGGCNGFMQPPRAPEGRGEMLAQPFKG
jgi:hypothetical protein